MAFSILKGGSCAAQLPFSSVRSQKSTLEKTVMSKTQNVFSSTPSWQNGSARARARVTHNTNPKWIIPPCVCCVYVCWQGVGDPNKTFIIFFQHEINHALCLFLKNKNIALQAPIHHLVMRDIDRYVHLISAGSFEYVIQPYHSPTGNTSSRPSSKTRNILLDSIKSYY